jgi:hypothetical protein
MLLSKSILNEINTICALSQERDVPFRFQSQLVAFSKGSDSLSAIETKKGRPAPAGRCRIAQDKPCLLLSVHL